MSPDDQEKLAEWERELVEEQAAKQAHVDSHRLAWLHLVHAAEVFWERDGVRISITPTEPQSLAWLVDRIRVDFGAP